MWGHKTRSPKDREQDGRWQDALGRILFLDDLLQAKGIRLCIFCRRLGLQFIILPHSILYQHPTASAVTACCVSIRKHGALVQQAAAHSLPAPLHPLPAAPATGACKT